MSETDSSVEVQDLVSAALRARLLKRRVEAVAERTESSSTFANPDGTVTVEQSTGPIRFRGSDGAWRDVDVSLVQAADGSVTSKAHPAGLTLAGPGGSAGQTRDLVSLKGDGRGVTWQWRGKLPRPVVDGTRATYPDVIAGVDLVVEATRTGFEQFLVVKQRLADPSVLQVGLPVTLQGLTARSDSEGGLEFVDGKTKVAGRLPTPVMWDARVDEHTGEHVKTVPVGLAVGGKDSAITLGLDPDLEFLNDPATVYPVTIDPSYTNALYPTFDTWVQEGYTTDQSSSTELKLGNNGAGQIARSFLNLNMTPWAGKDIISAKVALWETHSWSCSARGWRVGRTDAATTASRWTAQPTWYSNWGLSTETKGYSSTCANGWVYADVTGLIQAWADQSAGSVAIGLKAADETDEYGWKKFYSGNGSTIPRINITYNSYPATPTGLSLSPQNVYSGATYTSSLTPSVSAVVSDPDSGTSRAQFELSEGSAILVAMGSGNGSYVADGARSSYAIPTGKLVNGHTYKVRAQGSDGSLASKTITGYTTFVVDTAAPAAPAVTSTAWPSGAWSPPTSGTFNWSDVSTDVISYVWWLDSGTQTTTASTSTTLSNLAAGWHSLHVKAIDRAGNSAQTDYQFGVGNGSILTPAEEDRTQEAVTLSSVAPGSETKVTYKYLAEIEPAADPSTYNNVPVADVTGLAGGAWPQVRSATGAPFADLSWNVNASINQDGPVQLIACFNRASGGADICSAPVVFTLERTAFGASYATVPLGPGQVSLQTGDFAVDSGDAAVGVLTIGRTHTTLSPPVETGAAGVFGPGWSAGLPAPAGRAVYQLADRSANGYVLLTGPAGEVLTYTVDPNNANRFTGIGDAFDGSEITKVSSAEFRLTDKDGAQTTWSLTASGWAVTSVDEPGAEGVTTYSHDGQGRVTRMLASVSAGVTCPSGSALNPGCRALELTYAATTTATGTGSGQWGDYTGQLKQVSYTAYNPGTSAMATVPVASFSYDNTGHLRAAWDPRPSQALKTTYDYDAAGRLTSLTPPGLATWTMAYSNDGRLAQVSRQDPAHGAATQAVAYDVPVSGASAPIDLSSSAVGTWGQTTDLPREGAGIFPASHVPPRNAGSGAYTPASGDWQYAGLTYVDVNGREVNTAAYGAGAWQVATTGYDEHGAPVRALSAGNRAQALNPTADTDPHVAAQPSSAARADLLASASTYSANGDLSSETSPTHQVQLASGALASARTRTGYTYDPTRGLLTTTVVQPVTVDGNTTSAADTRTTLTGYDPIVTGDPSGWDLKQPTTETVVMSPSPDNVRRTRYDTAGRVIETRMPNSSGNDAGTTTKTYYTAAANSTYAACGGKPEWAGLVCRTGPAAQPAGQSIPVTTTTYDRWGNPATVTETSGSTTRTTTGTYDNAGRLLTQSVSVSPTADGGTPVPDTTTGYSPTTGLLTTQIAGGATITTGYDNLGRPTSYTDADNNNTTTTYTIDSRPATISDGKGTYTYTYDGTDAAGRTEHRGLPTSVNTGLGTSPSVFAAAYDPDGNLTRHDYPSGLTATTSYDNTGNPTRLTYTKAGTDWMTFTNIYSPLGQVLTAASPGSSQTYDYDSLGRLTQVGDAAGGSCTTRTYGFDPNSNRTSLAQYPAAADGTCTKTTTPTTQTHNYDAADRATDASYTYDRLGRTTTVPANAVSGGADLSIGYHANGTVATLTQNGATKTYTLDPANRIRATTDSTNPTLTNHYPGSGDSPVWIGAGTGWTRNILGLDGGLAAIQANDGTTELELPNLHGDIVATTDNATTATGVTAYFEHTEYGQPRPTDPTAGTRRYEWLGSHQRSSDTFGELVLMGARLHNPAAGRFLQTDPIPGGSANSYEYSGQDPVNSTDLTGQALLTRNKYLSIYMYALHHPFFGFRIGTRFDLYFTEYGTRFVSSWSTVGVGVVCALISVKFKGWGAAACAAYLGFYAGMFNWARNNGRCVKFSFYQIWGPAPNLPGPPHTFRCAR